MTKAFAIFAAAGLVVGAAAFYWDLMPYWGVIP